MARDPRRRGPHAHQRTRHRHASQCGYARGRRPHRVRSTADRLRAARARASKILEQKRALLEELASPTGSLPNLVRLVAAPASMPTPRPVRPPRFVNPAVVRNRSQSRAVALALGLEDGEALLIQGPPGTGKSTTAAEIDVQLILRDPGVRILVCSHSNHGTDNMLMKVLPFLEDADRAHRPHRLLRAHRQGGAAVLRRRPTSTWATATSSSPPSTRWSCRTSPAPASTTTSSSTRPIARACSTRCWRWRAAGG